MPPASCLSGNLLLENLIVKDLFSQNSNELISMAVGDKGHIKKAIFNSEFNIDNPFLCFEQGH